MQKHANDLNTSTTEYDAEELMDDARDKAADTLDDAADRTAKEGRRLNRGVAKVADRAASALGSTADYMRDRDSRDMMQDVGELAKKHPGASLATAVVLGFFLGRAVTRTSA